jgi:hypothetical protein
MIISSAKSTFLPLDPVRRTSRRSSIVHFERELNFTLVILAVAH